LIQVGNSAGKIVLSPLSPVYTPDKPFAIFIGSTGGIASVNEDTEPLARKKLPEEAERR